MKNELLGGDSGYDTRLMLHLHVERPVVATIASSVDADRYRGSLAIRFEATPGNLGRATAGIRHELERLGRDAVGPFERDRARSHRVAIDGLPPDTDATMDGARIMRGAQRHLHPQSLTGVYEGPRT